MPEHPYTWRRYGQKAGEEEGIRVERIAGWTVVMIIHVVAGMLLMMPANFTPDADAKEDVVQLVFIEPLPSPPPPPPPPEPPPPPKEIVIQKDPPPRPVQQPKPKPTTALPASVEQPVVDVPDPSPMDTYVEPAPPSPGPPSPGPPSPGPSSPSLAPSPPSNPNKNLRLSARVAPTPPYPPAAYRAGAEGEVVLLLTIDANGNVLDVSIEKSSGNRDLDRGARDWVKRKWKFHPTGQTEAGRLPIMFKLE